MRYLLPFLLLICASCEPRDEKAPADILEGEVFKSILLEVHLIDARASREILLDQQEQVPLPAHYQELLDRHGTTREEFQRTFQYYSARPGKLKDIYEEVLTELIRRKDLPAEQEAVIDTTISPRQDTVVPAYQPAS